MDTMNDNIQFNEQSLSELVDYLSNVAHFMIDINKEVLYKELFAKSEVIKSFVSERNTKMLCISKVEGDEQNSFNLEIKTDLLYKYPKSSTCCFIKKDSTLEINESKNFSSQIQVLNFSGDSSDSNVLSFMQTYIQNAFSPFFNTFQNANGSASNETRQNIKSTTLQTLQNKMSELVFLLNQSQKNSEIPTVKLEFEAEFKEFIYEIRAKGKEPTVDDFQDKIGNDIFLRKLADSTNRWKTDISAVLKLDRQISQGNTLEEITFWKDYENTLSNSK